MQPCSDKIKRDHVTNYATVQEDSLCVCGVGNCEFCDEVSMDGKRGQIQAEREKEREKGKREKEGEEGVDRIAEGWCWF